MLVLDAVLHVLAGRLHGLVFDVVCYRFSLPSAAQNPRHASSYRPRYVLVIVANPSHHGSGPPPPRQAAVSRSRAVGCALAEAAA